jgi:DNA-binding transcriptional LysR family regulator
MPGIDDLGAWRAFAAFARRGTMTAAAEELGVEPSSVSRMIAGLEKDLGCELIRHNVRPIALTEHGAAALKKAEAILRAVDSLKDSLQNDASALTGRIRLSSAPGFATRRLMPILEPFSRANPKISIDIMTGVGPDGVAKGVCDVAVVTGEPVQPGLVCTSRGRNLYLAVASPAYISRHGLPVRPEDLERHHGYVYAGPVRGETKFLCRGTHSAPVRYGTTTRSTDVLAIRQAVIDGTGVAVDLPLVQIYEDLIEGRLVPILPGWSREPCECFVITNRSAWRMRRVRVFFEWFAGAMRKYFKSCEEAASAIVGLPPDRPPRPREQIFITKKPDAA